MKYGMTTLCLLAVLITAGCGRTPGGVNMAETLSGVVTDMNGKRVSEQSLLDTNYLLLYFSAHWCPPCRAFTPKLVEFHKTNGGDQLFHTILISGDHSEADQFNYMKETKMPWPAVQYQSAAAKKLNAAYSGNGIPRLVLVDPTGTILADSFKGRTYLGPQVVLEKLKELLAKREIDPVGISAATGEHLPTPEKLARKFKINGFGQGTEQDIAIINGKFTGVGAELDAGIVVEQITATYVEVSYEGNRYHLYP